MSQTNQVSEKSSIKKVMVWSVYRPGITRYYRVFRNFLRTLPAIFDIENVDEYC